MSFTFVGSCWSDVYIASLARGISVAGDFLAATALVLALQTAGEGELAVSAVLVAITLPLVALAPLTGRLVDRVDSRTLLVTSGLAQALICAALAFAERPATVIALCALLSCGLAVTSPTLAALLPAMVTREDLPRASAISQTATSVGVVVAPALAGLLVGQFGAQVPLLIDATSYLAIVAAGLLLRTRRASRTAGEPVAPDAGQAHVAWRLRRDPLVAPMIAAIVLIFSTVGAINVVVVFFVRETLGASETAYGLVGAAWSAGLLLGAWLMAVAARRARDDAALVQSMIVMLGGTSAVVLCMAAVPAVSWLAPVFVLGGILNGGENVISNVTLGRRVPPESHGSAFAAFAAAVQGASMVGYLLGGLLLTHFAPRPLTALIGAAGLVMVAVSVVPIWRAARRERGTASHIGGTRPGRGARHSWDGRVSTGGGSGLPSQP